MRKKSVSDILTKIAFFALMGAYGQDCIIARFCLNLKLCQKNFKIA